MLIDLNPAFEWIVDTFARFDSINLELFGYYFSLLDVGLAVFCVDDIIELFFEWFGFNPYDLDKDLDDYD